MDFKFNTFEKFVVIFAIVIIIGGGVNGCAKKPTQDIIITPKDDTIQEQEKEPTRAETIGKMPTIVNALICVFSPKDCKKQ